MPRMRRNQQGQGSCGSFHRNHGRSCSKVSVSLPEDVIDFIDSQGDNRSKTIVTIIEDYKKKRENQDLAKAYEEYSEFCKEEGSEWEEAACKDLEDE